MKKQDTRYCPRCMEYGYKILMFTLHKTDFYGNAPPEHSIDFYCNKCKYTYTESRKEE